MNYSSKCVLYVFVYDACLWIVKKTHTGTDRICKLHKKAVASNWGPTFCEATILPVKITEFA